MTQESQKKHVFLFFGEDSYSITKKVVAWKKLFEKKYGLQTVSRIDIESFQGGDDELLGICKKSISSQSLFFSDSLCIIENMFADKKHRERLSAFFCDSIPKIPLRTFLVFVERRVDKRISLYKTFCDFEKRGLITMEEFLMPHGEILSRWIKSEVQRLSSSIEYDALSLLLSRFDTPRVSYSKQSDEAPDLWRLSLDLNACAAYAANRSITRDDITVLCPERPTSHVFDCSASLLKKDVRSTIKNAYTITSSGGADTPSVLGLCSFLQNQLHNMLIIKDMLNRNCSEYQISEKLDWNPQRTGIVVRQLKNVSIDFLKKALLSLIDLERMLKSRPVQPQSALLHALARALA